MRLVLRTLGVAALIGALALAFAACGGDDDADSDTTPDAAATTEGDATEPASEPSAESDDETPAAETDSLSDFDEQTQTSIKAFCVRAGDPVTLAEGAPMPLRAGEWGLTLAEYGSDLADAIEANDQDALAKLSVDITATCVAIGWTP